VTEAEWREVIDVNLTGVWNCCQAFGRVFAAGGGGTTVNVGSMSGQIANRPQCQPAYNASKPAVHHLPKSLAAEWPPLGIRVDALRGETVRANRARPVAAFPAREALVDEPTGRRWTYAQFAEQLEELARALLAIGVGTGDRVAIWAPNLPEWTFTQYATERVGAILVNINPAYRTSELEYVLRQSGTRVLVSAQRFKTSDYRAMVDEVRPRCPALQQVYYIGTDDWAGLLGQSSTVDGAALAAREAELSFDDPINIQYTSGTTGFPKGATLSHHNILNNGYFVARTQR